MYHEISNKSLCFGTPDARVLTDPDKITYSPSSASTIDVDDDDKDFQSSPAWQPKQPLKLEHEGENVGSSITQSVLQWQKLPEPMQSVVPPNYTYILDDYRELEREKAFLGAPDSNFHAIVRVNVTSSSGASKWIDDVMEHSKQTYRISSGRQAKGSKLLFRKDMHCQHGFKPATKDTCKKRLQKSPTLMSSLRNKKTTCQSSLSVKVYNPTRTCIEHHAKHSFSHCCHIELHHFHNHPLQSAHTLSFRPVAPDTQEAFHGYFKAGHSAASARSMHEFMLLQEDEFEIKLADRAYNPSLQDVNHLLQQWRLLEMGPPNGEDLFERLAVEVAEYNEKHAEAGGKALFQRYTSGSTPLILAVCTPLMARAHKLLRQSGEYVFCDATANLDRHNLAVFTLSTSHCGGGVPLGVVITSDETRETLVKAFQVLNKVLPEDAFHGRTIERRPEIFLTDDSSTERAALQDIWPDSTLLLCIFHYLQSKWTWLWAGRNKVSKEDRAQLILPIRDLVYAKNEEELCERYQSLLQNKVALKYSNFIQMIKSSWERRFEWALCYRQDLVTRGNHTNNYAEMGMRIIKEQVFTRVKAFNLVQMLHFLTKTLDSYYCRRLLSMAHNRFDRHVAKRFQGLDATSVSRESISCIGPAQYEVLSRSQEGVAYIADTAIGVCSCPAGNNGRPCVHQAAISFYFHADSLNVIPTVSVAGRIRFAELAVGKRNVK